MKIAIFGVSGKLGSAVSSALRSDGHEIVDARLGDLDGCDAGFEATRPDAATTNVAMLIRAGVPSVIGTSNIDADAIHALARTARVPCLYAPNFSIGAVLMIKLAVISEEYFNSVEIIEYHDNLKVDAPSGTANATALALRYDAPRVHSIRLPGFISRQSVVFGSAGEILTIDHETTSYQAFVPGVRLALERIRSLPPGLTIGLENLL